MKKGSFVHGLVGIALALVGLTVALAFKGDDIGGVFLMFMGVGLLLYGGDDQN